MEAESRLEGPGRPSATPEKLPTEDVAVEEISDSQEKPNTLYPSQAPRCAITKSFEWQFLEKKTSKAPLLMQAQSEKCLCELSHPGAQRLLDTWSKGYCLS